ncbi:gamma carbonic anhydrase family protein [Polymorphobacter multimanifer]|uniref:Carbonic anhydrase/acetyltransferase-like protein (Isoleucine patch superfamily) n=1 Tax=Polymorphobacter multimanifer TaxID=1070431 RepID=A0A841L5Q8_9SPHN|nr:gamma carbonic anhydrase family protein [Polymorphobacter multimanifer]MBB6227934.1 carbonic anhydrase/acetyltransferase-like protein (isoleucine patch superfamily) [Polymorphobacter multimanifer]GGI84933.1 gamma carbonic anhydrase family protein [Polymorphobacter multimanifer]
MTLHPFNGIGPTIDPSAFVAPGAQLIGDVTLGPDSSVWYNCVLRGDVERITVGARSNIQDGSVVHVTRKRHGTEIHDDVLVGHMAIIHGCVLESHSFIGLAGIVMDACVIEADGMLAAGSLLPPGKRIGAGELWTGRPARFTRALTPEEIARNRAGAAGYVELARQHRTSLAGQR